MTSLNFASLAKSRNDLLSVPSGYSAKVVYRSGDPIASGVPAYSNLGTDVPARYERSAGDCHDGVEFFALSDGAAVPSAAGSGNQCGILAMKHEYITAQCLHPAGPTHSALGLRPANEVTAK